MLGAKSFIFLWLKNDLLKQFVTWKRGKEPISFINQKQNPSHLFCWSRRGKRSTQKKKQPTNRTKQNDDKISSELLLLLLPHHHFQTKKEVKNLIFVEQRQTMSHHERATWWLQGNLFPINLLKSLSFSPISTRRQTLKLGENTLTGKIPLGIGNLV